jgi:hypothetical protein
MQKRKWLSLFSILCPQGKPSVIKEKNFYPVKNDMQEKERGKIVHKAV